MCISMLGPSPSRTLYSLFMPFRIVPCIYALHIYTISTVSHPPVSYACAVIAYIPTQLLMPPSAYFIVRLETGRAIRFI
ncbi:hypothetical protein K438DRAFT_1828889 [Mycena galopus ATCC 62051]|nr:hypothetical protein K438DRAFT_1828889 [Mycena galopus ATCC 62051]